MDFYYEDEQNSIMMEYVKFNNISILMKPYWVNDKWDLKNVIFKGNL